MKGLTLVKKLYLLIASVAVALAVLAALAQRAQQEMSHELEGIGRLPELQAMLGERTVDHYRWAQGLAVGAMLLGKEFTGKLDPHECALGQWYYGFEPPPELAEAFEKVEQPHARMHATAEKVLAPLRAGDLATAKALFEQETMPALADTQAAIGGLQGAVRAMIATHIADTQRAHVRTQRVTLVVYGVVLVLLVIGATMLLARPLQRNLAAMGSVFERLGAGDLTVRAPAQGHDELARLAGMANTMIERMQTALLGVSAMAAHVRASARELTATSQALSSSVQEQAASLEETSASLGQMTDTVKENAGCADELHGKAEGALAGAQQGSGVIQRAVASMRAMTTTATRIGEIIETMDEMSFQTNLLALNAAVEAARAGEQGKSFAVVAGEVRALAQRSAEASREIKTLITETVGAIAGSARLTDEAGNSFAGIVGGVREVAGLIARISAASREQAEGIGQVSTAMAQLDSVTQGNAAQSEELSATAETLAAGANDLSAQVARFTLGDDAGEAHAPRAVH